MNKLSLDEQVAVLAALTDGASIRATVRMTGTAKNTICRLLNHVGYACEVYQERTLRNLPCQRLQMDEIWSFVGKKAKNTTEDDRAEGMGDVWTWTALDPDSKLIASWMLGDRSSDSAYTFVSDLAGRLRNRVQISTDGHRAYLDAIPHAFKGDVDWGIIIKIYGKTPYWKRAGLHDSENRYSPSDIQSVERKRMLGDPDFGDISTSLVERQNLTMRMQMRRMTRLTNGFSKKYQNHMDAIALHFMIYNFVREHGSLDHQTPAMAAGVADHAWTLEEVVKLTEAHPLPSSPN